MLCNKLSLRGHKGVRNSKFSKYCNWAETWLKVCVWHSNHDKTYGMLLHVIKGSQRGPKLKIFQLSWMLWYSMSLRGHKGVQKSNFSKCSNLAETWLKVCVWHFKHNKTYAMLQMSLRGHKGVRKSKFSKCSNWAQTWLKVCVWHFKHD